MERMTYVDEDSGSTDYLCRWISDRHGLMMTLRSANWFRAVTLPTNAAWRHTKSAEQWPGLLAQVATDRQRLNDRLYLNHDYTSARRQTGHFEVAPHRHVARTEAADGSDVLPTHSQWSLAYALGPFWQRKAPTQYYAAEYSFSR